MATALIYLNGDTTPLETLVMGDVVNLANADDTDVVTWLWTLEAIPFGSTATLLTSPDAQFTAFVADIEGAYRVSLRVNGGPKDLAVARVRTIHKHLQPLAKNETSEGDDPGLEGWAKPWRETYLTIDKALGLSDRRTVVYTGGSEVGLGPFVLEVVGEYYLPNGDMCPAVDIANPNGDDFRGKGLYLFDSESSPPTNVPISVLARGMSELFDDPSSTQGGIGLTGGDYQNVILGNNQGRIIHENDYINQPSGDRRFYLGHCMSQVDGGSPLRIWFNPVTGAPDTTHGFLPNPAPQYNWSDGGDPPSTLPYHAIVDENYAGFMSPSQKKLLESLTENNLLDNGGFELWQRGSGALDYGHFPLSQSDLPYPQFLNDPVRSYNADRWYGTAYNNDQLTVNNHDVSGTWSKSDARSIYYQTSQARPFAMRMTNKSQNVAASGTDFLFGNHAGIAYYLVQELDPKTIREQLAGGNGGRFAARFRMRGGTGLHTYAELNCGVIATSTPNPGTFAQYKDFQPFYNVTTLFCYGYQLSNNDWQDIEVNWGNTGQLGQDLTAAAFVLWSEHPSSSVGYGGGDGGSDYDYWEVNEITLVTGSIVPKRFVNKGGSLEADIQNCKRWYEKSYPLEVAPGLPSLLGVKRGMVTFSGENVIPDIRFDETKTEVSGVFPVPYTGDSFGQSSVREIQIIDPISGSFGMAFVSGSGLVPAATILTSSLGFSVQLDPSQVFGSEVQFHYTSSVDI